jgi:hypothetical protein
MSDYPLVMHPNAPITLTTGSTSAMNNNKEGSVVSRSGRRGTGPGSVVGSGDSGGSWFGALTGLFFADDRWVPPSPLDTSTSLF